MKFWTPPKMWDGADVWIIGGGSSLPRQFKVPDDVIRQVESGKLPITVYSDYFKPLHDKHVIGVNIAFMLGDWISALYFCDRNFLRVYLDQISDFKNLKVTDTRHLAKTFFPQAQHIKRMDRNENAGISTKPDTICWNQNSGAAAINFAIHAGARRILLLGFDMKPTKSGRTHWHEGFQNYGKPTIDKVFQRFMRYFPKIAEDAKALGVEILNVNPNSALDCFKKVSLEEVL